MIDSLIIGGFELGFWTLALTVGALRVNPAAEQQLQSSPLTLPNIAPYEANLPLLAAMLAVFTVLIVAYAALFWAFFRGLPGQKMMSLQVGSATSGRNLGLRRALVRSFVVLGIPMAALAGVLYGVFAFETSVPWSDVINPVPGGPAESWLARWSTLLLMALLLALLWPLVLLISTALSRTRQGLHDRLSGSLVVGRALGQSWAGGYRRSFGPGGSAPSDGPQPGSGSTPGYRPPLAPGQPTTGASPWPSGSAGAADASPASTPPPESPASPDSGLPGPTPTGIDPRWRGGWTDPSGGSGTGPSAPDGGPVWLRTAASEAAPTLRSASITRRVFAYLFDCVLVYMIFSLSTSVITAALMPSADTSTDDKTLILLGLVGGFEQMAYFVAGWVVWQGTLAQRFMHIQTAQATTGKPIGWMDGLVRWAMLQGPFALMTIVPSSVRIIVFLAATSWGLYLLYSTVTDPELRGLHDRFLNSQVADDI